MREAPSPRPAEARESASAESKDINQYEKHVREFLSQIDQCRSQLFPEGQPPSQGAEKLWDKFNEWYQKLERPEDYELVQSSEKLTEEMTGRPDSDILLWSLMEKHPPVKETLASQTPAETQILRETLDCFNGARIANLKERVTCDVLCHELSNRRHFHDCFVHEVARVKKIKRLWDDQINIPDISTKKNIPTGKSYVVAFDINNFKRFNEEQGHLRGDQALQKVAQAMKKTFRRHSDVIARVGGDEFAILAHSPTIELLIGDLGKLMTSLEQESIGTGFGVSEILPTDSKDFEESWECAYHRADLAAKEAKDRTKKSPPNKPFKGAIVAVPDPTKRKHKSILHNFLPNA